MNPDIGNNRATGHGAGSVQDQQGRHRNMLGHNYAGLQPKTPLKLRVGCCLGLTFFLLPSAVQVSAHMAVKPVSDLTLQLDVGFNSSYRMGSWTPVRVTLGNTGADFSGMLAINTFSGVSRTDPGTTNSPWSVQQTATLARGPPTQLPFPV